MSKKLFQELEQYAASLGYKAVCLDSENHENHPRKPEDYKEIDYSKLGYVLDPNIICIYDKSVESLVGECIERPYRINFWFKNM